MGLGPRQLGLLLAASLVLTSCGSGGLAFTTIARDHSSAGSDAHYLGIATTPKEAVTVVSPLMAARALESLDRFSPPSGRQILVVFQVGRADGRNDEVGFIERVEAKEDRMEVRIEWTDDGLEDDNDEDLAPYHVIVMDAADIPDEARGLWVAVNSDGRVLAEVRYPATPSETVEPVCVRTVPAGYEDLIQQCPQ